MGGGLSVKVDRCGKRRSAGLVPEGQERKSLDLRGDGAPSVGVDLLD